MSELFSDVESKLTSNPNKQGALIDDFTKHAKAISYILQVNSVKELCRTMEVALKQIFKVGRVTFLFQDKETIELLHKEGAPLRVMGHLHENFHVLVPDGVKRLDHRFEFKFRNMADVKKGDMYQGPIAVTPVTKLMYADQTIMLIQLEHRKATKLSFDKVRDRAALETMARIISGIFERIVITNRTVLTQERAYSILNTCKFLSKRLRSQA